MPPCRSPSHARICGPAARLDAVGKAVGDAQGFLDWATALPMRRTEGMLMLPFWKTVEEVTQGMGVFINLHLNRWVPRKSGGAQSANVLGRYRTMPGCTTGGIPSSLPLGYMLPMRHIARRAEFRLPRTNSVQPRPMRSMCARLRPTEFCTATWGTKCLPLAGGLGTACWDSRRMWSEDITVYSGCGRGGVEKHKQQPP